MADIEQTIQEIDVNIETQHGTYWGTIVGDINDQSDLVEELGKRVSKNGDNIDGDLVFVTSSGNGGFIGQREGSVVLGYVFSSGTKYPVIKVTNQGVNPTINLGYILGSSNAKWSNIYTKRINNGGNIEIPEVAGSMVVATPPSDNGTYVLKCIVQDGIKTYEWVEE